MNATNQLVELLRFSADASSFRRESLAALCCMADCKGALLFLGSDAAQDLREAARWGEVLNSEEYRRVALQSFRDFNGISDGSRVILGKESCTLVQLLIDGRMMGIAVLLVSPAVADLSEHSGIRFLAAFLALYEQNQKLLQLLEITQKIVREVSDESAGLARRNAQLFQQLVSNQERLRSISKGVIRMQEEERSKISRELHDGVGQGLTALKMNIDLISEQLQNQVSSDSRQRVQEIRALAEQSLQEVRELARLLRPRMLDDFGLLPTLKWHVKNFAKRTGIEVNLELQGDTLPLDPQVESMLFRIVQEALNNVAKHSQAKSAVVRLTCSDSAVELQIADRGIGFRKSALSKASPDSGSGLLGIRDRVLLWGGKFNIRSSPGSGTGLKIRIPIEEKPGKR